MGRKKGGKNKKTEMIVCNDIGGTLKETIGESINEKEVNKISQERKEKLKRVMREINTEYKDPEMAKFASSEPQKNSK